MKVSFKISHLIFIFIVGAFLLPSLILAAFVLKTQANEQRVKEVAADQAVTTITEQVLAVETGLYATMVRTAREGPQSDSAELLVAGVLGPDGQILVYYNQHPDAPFLTRDSVLVAVQPLMGLSRETLHERLFLGVKTGVPPAYFRKFNLVATRVGDEVLFGLLDNMPLSNRLAAALEPLSTDGYVAVLSPYGEIVYAPEIVRYRVESQFYEKHSSAPQEFGLAEDYNVRTTAIAKHAPGSTVMHLSPKMSGRLELTRTLLVVIFSMVLSLILGVIAAQSIRGSIAMPIEHLSDTFRRTGLAEATEDTYQDLLVGLVAVRHSPTNVREIADLLHGTAGLAERLSEYQAKVVENAKYQAVGLATQMLAHDVRKPFSKLRIGLSSLKTAGSWDAMKAIATRLTAEVERSLASVQGMIEDVMEASAQVPPTLETASPIQLIDTTLRETLMVAQAQRIAITYDLRHTRAVHVAPLKVARILHNIIENALQATQDVGTLWFASRDVTDGDGRIFVEFCIGNTGSYIEMADRENVFRAFFTKGKARGTGLGLPIARKIVESHGGRIWCTSSREKGTEFLFTLVAADAAETRRVTELPPSSEAILNDQSHRDRRNRDGDRRLATAAADLLALYPRRLNVVVIDDDAVYARDVHGLIAGSEIAASMNVTAVTSGFENPEGILATSPDIVICDIDFGLDGYNGLDLARKLNQATPRPFLCVHSNRVLGTDARAAYDAGADIFLRKPMTEAALCDLFRAMRATRKASDAASAVQPPGTFRDVSIAVIDDDPFICEAWISALTPAANVRTFLSPEAFLAVWDRGEEWERPLACIVSDFYFDKSSAYDGHGFALELARNGCSVPIVLSSDAALDEETTRAFRAVIGKVPLTLAALLTRIGKTEVS